jgi:hypothetical protein
MKPCVARDSAHAHHDRLHAFKSLRATRISRTRFSTGKAKTPGN